MHQCNLREIQILHVDDEPSFTDLTATFLEREDDRFIVETATSADEGLRRINDRPPDCVISDYNMPGMDGIEFLQTIREEHSNLPFILFTGKGSEAVASEAVSAGVTDYLQKESASEQYELLANRIQNVVTARQDAEEATRQQDLMERAEVLGSTGGWELRLESEDLRLTDGIKRIYGVEPDRDLSLGEVIDFYEPDSQRRISGIIDDAIEDGYAEASELRLHTAGGECRIVEGNAELVDNDEDGTLLRGVIRDVTDSKERKRELDRLQQAIDDANVSITLANPSQPDDPLVYVNNAFEQMTGYPSEETLGRNCRFLQGEGTAPEKIATLREAIDNEESVSVELRNYRKDGTEFWNRLTVTPIYDDDNTLVRYLGTQEDVTERKERERELERYERLVENLPVGVFRTTIDGEIIEMNEATMDIYGAESPAQLQNKRAEELYIDDTDRDDLLDRLQETGRIENELLEFETLDGDRRFVRTTLTLNEGGERTHLEGILQDVTDRRELKREFDQIKTIAESLNDAVYVIDEHGQFTYVNNEFLELTGYSEETVLGNTPALIKSKETVERGERQLGRLLSDDGPDTVTFETVIQPNDGEPIVCEDHMGVLPYESDSFNGSVGVLRDISEHKRRERELRRERDRLDEFASVVSHDLRNPLNVAQGNLELLDGECDSDKIEPIKRAHTRMDDLIDDLLTLARQGETVSDMEAVGLREIAEDAWRTVESPYASLHVETDRTILCDPSRLRQMLENLYRNAVEHGGSEVSVTVGDVENGFAVEDTGPGIPEDERKQVFEPGYSTAADGTGFGLRIVSQTAEAHGWTVRVTESEAGGARFEVTGITFADS